MKSIEKKMLSHIALALTLALCTCGCLCLEGKRKGSGEVPGPELSLQGSRVCVPLRHTEEYWRAVTPTVYAEARGV